MSFRRGTRKDGSRFTHPVGHPSDDYKIEAELTPEYMSWTMNIEKKISKLEDIMKSYILDNLEIFVGCPEVGNLTHRILEKLSIPSNVYTGKVLTFDGKEVYHIWIESFDLIIDPNPSQIIGIPLEKDVIKVMPKAEWEELTKPTDVRFIDLSNKSNPFTQTKAGEKFFDNMAEEIARKVNEAVI